MSPELRMELASSLFDSRVPMLLMATIFAAVGFAIVGESRDGPLLAFFGAGNALMLSRIALLWVFQSYRRRAGMDPGRMLRWERAFAGLSFAFAACLGGLTARGVQIGSSPTHELSLALLFGHAAGLVARMSLRPWISVTSLALACAPPVVTLVLSGEPDHMIIAAVALTFALGSLETTRYIYRAVSRDLAAKNALGDLARHDPLTGLPNRMLLAERLRSALSGSHPFAVHYIDLDRFKPVNDSYGHATGDALLRAVGLRIKRLLRDGDMVGRIGGDEFVVLQHECKHREEAESLARRVLRALHTPFEIAGREIQIGASVGIAIAPQAGTDPRALTAAADAALYDAKARGRGGFVLAPSRPALAG